MYYKFNQPLFLGFLKDSSIEYFWFINDTNYGPTEQSAFFYKFSKPGNNSKLFS